MGWARLTIELLPAEETGRRCGCGDGHGGHQAGFAGAVAGIDDDRQMRQPLHHSDRSHVEQIAGRLVKEIAFYGGAIDKFVSPAVAAEVAARVETIGRKGD